MNNLHYFLALSSYCDNYWNKYFNKDSTNLGNFRRHSWLITASIKLHEINYHESPSFSHDLFGTLSEPWSKTGLFAASPDLFPQVNLLLNSVYNLQQSDVSNASSTLFKHFHFTFA